MSVIIISQFIKGNLRHVIVVSIRDRINSRLAARRRGPSGFLLEERKQRHHSRSRGLA